MIIIFYELASLVYLPIYKGLVTGLNNKFQKKHRSISEKFDTILNISVKILEKPVDFLKTFVLTMLLLLCQSKWRADLHVHPCIPPVTNFETF